MGGELELDDTPGGGTTAIVTLKAVRVVTRVLVVDDEPQILRALVTNLQARGYDVDAAGTGEIALAARGPAPARSRRARPRPPRHHAAST